MELFLSYLKNENIDKSASRYCYYSKDFSKRQLRGFRISLEQHNKFNSVLYTLNCFGTLGKQGAVVGTMQAGRQRALDDHR